MIYKIDEIEYKLRDFGDYTINETEYLEDITKSFEAVGNTINIKLQNQNIKKLLSVILMPVTMNSSEVDFGKVKQSELLKIMKDFFLSVMNLSVNGKQDLKE